MTALRSVSYVMPVLNEEKYLETAVLSILQQEFEGPVEVIIALGPSTDATDAIAENLALSYPVTIVRNAAGTTSSGLNVAIAAAKNDVVVRVDAHAKLMPGYTKLAVEVLNQTGAANVGGVMKAVGHRPFQSAVAWGYNSPFGLGGGSFHVGGAAGPSDSVYLGVFRRSVLEKLGGFDPAVIRGQDWELNLRIRNSGEVVWFDPRLQVEYHPRSSWRHLARQFFDTGIWRGELTRRNLKAANLRYFAPPALVVLLSASGIAALLGWSLPLLLPLGYLSAVAALGIYSGRRVLPGGHVSILLALPTMHISWGAGFIAGFVFRAKPKTGD
ncbi:MAG: glycosyltransferase family 2 protein [Micrococcales bacterium]